MGHKPRALPWIGAIAFALIGSGARAEELEDLSEATAAERLAAPTTMARCPGVQIIEWRSSRFMRELTEASADGIKVLEDACATALSRYASFLESRNLKFVRQPIAARVMLMPANTVLDGKEPRNLNDVLGRFHVVQPNCCSWGIYNAVTRAVFLRNDPVLRGPRGVVPNRYFTRTTLHEMAHVLNDQWLVRVRNYLSPARDEELAEEWVGLLGITFPTESSSENVAVLGAARSASK
jgi:hypothetical protein